MGGANRFDVSIGEHSLTACRLLGTDRAAAGAGWQSTTFEIVLADTVPGHEVRSCFMTLTDQGPVQVSAQTVAWTTP